MYRSFTRLSQKQQQDRIDHARFLLDSTPSGRQLQCATITTPLQADTAYKYGYLTLANTQFVLIQAETLPNVRLLDAVSMGAIPIVVGRDLSSVKWPLEPPFPMHKTWPQALDSIVQWLDDDSTVLQTLQLHTMQWAQSLLRCYRHDFEYLLRQVTLIPSHDHHDDAPSLNRPRIVVANPQDPNAE